MSGVEAQPEQRPGRTLLTSAATTSTKNQNAKHAKRPAAALKRYDRMPSEDSPVVIPVGGGSTTPVGGAPPCYICFEPVRQQENSACCPIARHESCEWRWQIENRSRWGIKWVARLYRGNSMSSASTEQLVRSTAPDVFSTDTDSDESPRSVYNAMDATPMAGGRSMLHRIFGTAHSPTAGQQQQQQHEQVPHLRWCKTYTLPCSVCKRPWRTFHESDPYLVARLIEHAQIGNSPRHANANQVPIIPGDVTAASMNMPLFAALFFGTVGIHPQVNATANAPHVPAVYAYEEERERWAQCARKTGKMLVIILPAIFVLAIGIIALGMRTQ